MDFASQLCFTYSFVDFAASIRFPSELVLMLGRTLLAHLLHSVSVEPTKSTWRPVFM